MKPEKIEILTVDSRLYIKRNDRDGINIEILHRGQLLGFGVNKEQAKFILKALQKWYPDEKD